MQIPRSSGAQTPNIGSRQCPVEFFLRYGLSKKVVPSLHTPLGCNESRVLWARIIYSLKPLQTCNHPVTTARRAHKELASGPLHFVKQCKKVFSAIPPDASAQLVAPNGQRFKRKQLYITEDLEHISSSWLSSNRTDVPGLSTVIRAPEIGVTNIDVAVGPTNRIGQEGLYLRG